MLRELLKMKVNIAFVTLGVLLLSLIYLIVQLSCKGEGSLVNCDSKLALPLLMIITTSVAILLLTLVSTVFSIIHQNVKKAALGLPEGSVRALIALSLIMTFTITAIILYSDMNNQRVDYITLDPAHYQQLPASSLRSSMPVYKYIYTPDVNGNKVKTDSAIISWNVGKVADISQESHDFSKQLLTTLSTLVIAISAFYFGTRANETGYNLASKIFEKHTETRAAEPTAKIVTDPDLIELAIKRNLDTYKEKPGFLSLVLGTKLKDGQKIPCAVFHISDTKTQDYPATIAVNPADPDSARVETDIVRDVGKPRLLAGMTSKISCVTAQQCFGTLTCALGRGGEKYLMTCCHVLSGKTRVNSQGFTEENRVKVIDSDSNIVGDWCYSLFDGKFDIALISPDDSFEILTSNIKAPRKLLSMDVLDSTKVIMRGAVSGHRAGYIINTGIDMDFPLEGGEISFTDLIIISGRPNQPFVTISDDGDSGAIIYDESSKEALGMVIGGNNQFTYAVPMHSIFNLNDFKSMRII